jgi:hypothetical protein
MGIPVAEELVGPVSAPDSAIYTAPGYEHLLP